MATSSRMPFPAPPWDRLMAAVGAAAAAAFLVLAAVVAVPPSLENARAALADGVASISVGDAAVVVPKGWVVSEGAGGALVRTPDGGLSIRMDAVAGEDPRTVLQVMLDRDLGAVPTATVGPVRTEVLASGLTVVHADVGADAVYAVVRAREHSTVRMVARAAEGGAIEDYRPALGLLLEGVRP